MAEHHLCREDEGAGVDLVLACVLGRRAVRGLEDGNPRVVVDVGAGGDADATDLCGQGVGDVVAVEVHGGQDAVFCGTGDDLLEHGIGNHVLDHDGVAGVGVGEGAPRATVELGRTEFFLGQGVAPISEATLGELHDVAFVNQGNARLVVVNGVLDGCPDDTSRAFF